MAGETWSNRLTRRRVYNQAERLRDEEYIERSMAQREKHNYVHSLYVHMEGCRGCPLVGVVRWWGVTLSLGGHLIRLVVRQVSNFNFIIKLNSIKT